MTKLELKKFTAILAARASELEGLIRNREAAAIETSADALDQIQHAVERELALGTLARESSGLRETNRWNCSRRVLYRTSAFAATERLTPTSPRM